MARVGGDAHAGTLWIDGIADGGIIMALELYSVIKNDGPADLLYWKFAGEDFRTGSQLIVAENEEALFVRDGVIQETFSGGKFTLTTNNYPFIDKVRSFFSGGVNSFSCKVYFVNKADLLDIKWGTDAPIQVFQPSLGVQTHVCGRGSVSIRVKDAKKFVLKFVGNNVQMVTPDLIQKRFRSAFLQKIKTLIGKTVNMSDQHVTNVLADLEVFAEQVTPRLAEVFDEYGIELVNFYIETLEIPEDDPWYREQGRALAQAHGDSAQLKILGGDWQRVQKRDLMRTVAENEGAAGLVAGMGASMGMGVAAGGAFGAMARSFFAETPASAPVTEPPPTPTPALAECEHCHARIPAGNKFCPECGGKIEVRNRFCTNCGKPLQAGAKFCPECGTKQDA